jgi:hypothetical protein
MKGKLILVYFIVLKLGMPVTASGKDTVYVKVEFIGETNKSLMPIIFYLPGSLFLSEGIGAYKFEVTKSQFEQIATCIATNKFETKNSYGLAGGRSVDFTVRFNESIKSFTTNFAKPLSEILDCIKNVFVGTPEAARISETLDSYAKMLFYSHG